MKIRIEIPEHAFSIPAPSRMVLNAPVIWCYLRKNGQMLPFARCAHLVKKLRAWKKQYPHIPLVEVRTEDTCIRIDL